MCEVKSAGAVSYMSKHYYACPGCLSSMGTFVCTLSRVKDSKVLEASCVNSSLWEQSHTCLNPCVKDSISPQGPQCSKTLGRRRMCSIVCVHRSHS